MQGSSSHLAYGEEACKLWAVPHEECLLYNVNNIHYD